MVDPPAGFDYVSEARELCIEYEKVQPHKTKSRPLIKNWELAIPSRACI